MIDTRKVKDRRALRFDSLETALADAAMLAEAEQRGSLRSTGNWTLGQALGHLAYWARAPFEGYPDVNTAPWYIRVIARPFKGYLLNGKLPAGTRIPKAPEGTYGIDLMETEEGLSRLREAFGRLSKESPSVPNVVFGKMSHNEWIQFNLRHAELHLSFFHPQ